TRHGVDPSSQIPCTLNEMDSARARVRRLLVLYASGMENVQRDSVGVQVGAPAADDRPPDGLIVDVAGDDAEPHFFATHRPRDSNPLPRLPMVHQASAKIAVSRQNRQVVLLDVSEEERLQATDGSITVDDILRIKPPVELLERLGKS